MAAIFPPRPRILVIGDVHGDIQRLAQCFIQTGLINRAYQWTAQPADTWVVQLGDQVDSLSRGASQDWETLPDVSVLQFMEQMDALARPYGGRVISLLGNHELMNIQGDFSYVSAKSLAGSGQEAGRRQKFRPGGTLARQLAQRPVVLKIGGLLFCHAGLLPQHLALATYGSQAPPKERAYQALAVLNDWSRRFLTYEPFHPEEAERMKRVLLDTEGLLWNRHYADASPENEREREESLTQVLSLLDARAMFVGHTTVPHILALYDRRLWFVDNGLSRAFQTGPMQLLEILNDGVPLLENNHIPYRVLVV